MKPQQVEQQKLPAPKGALPGTFLRLCWFVRMISPSILVAPLLLYVFESVRPTDFDRWLAIPWKALAYGKADAKLDVDLLAENLITPNAVTKTLTATALILVTFYVTDLRTTGRRPGWHLVGHPMNSSRLREFFMWTMLFFLFAAVTGAVIAMRVNDVCKPLTALEFTLIAHLAALLTLVLANRNFAAYLLLVPSIQARRKQARAERIARRKQRLQERQKAQIEAKRERDVIRAKRARIVELQEACRELDADIAYLESSDQPSHLVDEQLAEIRLRRSELDDEIDRLTIELS